MNWTSIRNLIVVVCLYILMPLSFVSAQTGNTSVHGTITDPKGSTVPGAKITLSNSQLGINLETTTNKEGVYQFVEIRPGTYELTVTASGFAVVRQTNLQLLVATPTTSDIQLQLSSGTTTVEVVGTSQMINTQDATIGTAFGQTQLTALPFEGRDPAGILSLQPGVVTVSDRGKVDTNGDSRGGSVNGARSDQTNITLDGIGDNDEVAGTAFQGALRATLDSIEEFRVVTTNSDADQGRSSGAQVQLVTKSGTNRFHGTAYEYNRPTNMVANDYFNKHAELQNDEPNIPPRLLRNTFGGSFGGPIIKDKLFIFAAYEGQRTRESYQVTRAVPSDSLRDGVIYYQCDSTSPTVKTDCPGGSVTGLSGSQYGIPAPVTNPDGSVTAYNALNPTQIAGMDPNCTGTGTCPWGPGVNPNSIATMQKYPHPNTDQLGDGFNYRGYTFSAATPAKTDTYITRIDYNLTKDQTLFVRGGLQNDHGVPTSTPGVSPGTNTGAPQFPGQPASTVATNNTKGIVAGYQWTISPTKVNSLHYGYIRQGLGVNGSAFDAFVRMRGLDTTTSQNRSTTTIVPVHNITDDFSWTKGNHTFQFGGNYRLITNNNSTNSNSFSQSLTNSGFLDPTGIANHAGISFDPATFGFPAVDGGFQNSYDYPMMALAGILTETDTVYVQDKAGNFLAPGAFVNRSYRDNEVEFYFKDSWRIKSNLTINAGLRYSLLQPPYERNGNQVCPSFSLHDFFQTRMADMVQGTSYSPDFNMDLCGQANGKAPAWGWDHKNLAPRLSLAWSPGYKDGLLGALFGGPGKSSVRMGAGIYYDHFGQGVITTYDQQGSFGFISNTTYPPGTVSVDTAPRYTGEHDLPASLLYPAPTPGFPVTPPDAFSIYWGLDDKLKTPYSYAFDFSISRELKSGFTLELAYVGRLGRRLLQEKDLAQPANLFDPQNGVSYFQAVTALAKVYRQGVSTQSFNPASLPANIQAYWAYMMQPLQAGGAYQISSCTGGATLGTASPVVAAYDLFCGGSLNETLPLANWDTAGIPDARNAPNCDSAGNPACVGFYFPKNGPYSFYQAQDASLFAWSTGGRSNYNALQVMLHHRATHGLTFDFNYSFSKSIDMTSDAERVSLFQGSFFGTGEIYNPFDPGQFRAVSDYDMTHQFNMNWVYELPFGKNHAIGSNWNRAANAVLGGWTWSGLGRWTSGLPFSVQNGFQFPTNWELNGVANLTGAKPQTGAFTDSGGDMNEFKNPTTALAAFDYPFPGGVGSRNVLRGPGYFGFDMALRKEWSFTERQKLAFSWEVFNVTNSVRFDVFSALPAIDNSGSFGKYSQTLTGPRVMEFMLRYSF